MRAGVGSAIVTGGPQTGRGGLIEAVRAALVAGARLYGTEPRLRSRLDEQLDRLDQPLRVAIAGKVKAGKSTLLNALVGEQVAATDAGECTRIVTWYQDGPSPRIVVHPHHGEATALPVVRRDGALVVDLRGHAPEATDRMVVDWPAPGLRDATLIDTPGTASLSAGTSRRTLRFLRPDDGAPTEADAVVYLLRQMHASDSEFLEAFRDHGVARAASVNTVGVLSRADEIGGGRLDAMESARAVARRYRAEPALRGLCQNFVAVAGLLAQTARTLRHSEFLALATLARSPEPDLRTALLTADLFAADDPRTSGLALPPAARRALLGRFGLFGIRLGVTLLGQGVDSPAALAGELVHRSGLGELQHVLHNQLAERRDLLKARSALLALDAVLGAQSRPGSAELSREVERLWSGAHEFAELRMLTALRSGSVPLPPAVLADAERLLGDAGAAVRTRLALPPDATPAAVRAAALQALGRWQDRAENPMTARAAADACRVVVRTCEGILAPVSMP